MFLWRAFVLRYNKEAMKTLLRVTYSFTVRVRRSAGYYHDEFAGLSKGVYWLTLAQVISLVASFLLTLAFTHYLSKAEYGTFKYFFSIASILAVPTLPGMIPAVTRAVARGNEHIYRVALFTRLKWSSISGFLASLLALYYFTAGNTAYAIISLIIALTIPLSGAFTTYRAYLSGKTRFRAMALAHIASRIFVTLCAVFVAILTQNILFTLITFFFAGFCTNFFFTLLFPPRKTRPEIQSVLKSHPAITYGKHLSALRIISVIAEYADNVILFLFLGPTAVAVYALAVTPIKRMNLFFARTSRPILVARFSEHTPGELKRILPFLVGVLFLFATLLALLYFLLAPLVFGFLFPDYQASIPLTQLAIVIILLTPFALYNTALVSQMQTKRLMVQKLTSRIFKLIAIAVLTYYFGLVGMVVSLILFILVYTVMNIILFQTVKDEPTQPMA